MARFKGVRRALATRLSCTEEEERKFLFESAVTH